MISFCFTHIYTVHFQTICMMFICDSCKARISVGIISKHIKPCTDWKLWDDYSWFSSIPGVKDFKKIPAFIKIKIHKAKIIDHKKIQLGQPIQVIQICGFDTSCSISLIRVFAFIYFTLLDCFIAVTQKVLIETISNPQQNWGDSWTQGAINVVSN